jgi:hypothetical protein
MILVDSSVWIDHIRYGVAALEDLLQRNHVLSHPAVIGELALGRPRQEEKIIADMSELLPAEIADHDEVLHFIRRNSLGGSGIGYADAHLLASTQLTADAALWTRDRRLLAAARRLGLDADVEPYGGVQED